MQKTIVPIIVWLGFDPSGQFKITIAVAIGNAVQRRMSQWQREGPSPKGLTPSTVSPIVAVTMWTVEHNVVGLITHALRCDPQVQRLVPEDSLHVRTAEVWKSWECSFHISLVPTALTPHRSSASGSAYCGSFLRHHHERLASARHGLVSQPQAVTGMDVKEIGLSAPRTRLPEPVQHKLSPVWLTGSKACPSCRQQTYRDEPVLTQGWSVDWHRTRRVGLQLQNRVDSEADVWCRRRRNQRCSRRSLLEPSWKAFHHQRGGVCFSCLQGSPTKPPCLWATQWVRQLAEARWQTHPLPALRGVVRGGSHAARRCKGRRGIFRWGTVMPEPPVERLAAVAATKSKEPVEPLWRAIASAERLGCLKPVHKHKIKRL